MRRRAVTITMVTGRMYRIRHRAKGTPHDVTSVMRYLGVNNRPGPIVHRFSARPVAGVQNLPHRHIVAVEEVATTKSPVVNSPTIKDPSTAARAPRATKRTAKKKQSKRKA